MANFSFFPPIHQKSFTGGGRGNSIKVNTPVLSHVKHIFNLNRISKRYITDDTVEAAVETRT